MAAPTPTHVSSSGRTTDHSSGDGGADHQYFKKKREEIREVMETGGQRGALLAE